jgi:hypothetical protein
MTTLKDLKNDDLCSAWVTKYDFQARLVEGRITIGAWSRGRRTVQFRPEGANSYFENLVMGKDVFLSREEAVADVRARRSKKLAQLQEIMTHLQSTPEIEEPAGAEVVA